MRLIAGSDEAGYLTQILPISKIPTVIMMKDGQLKEYITSGTTKEDFLRRARDALSTTQSPIPPLDSNQGPALDAQSAAAPDAPIPRAADAGSPPIAEPQRSAEVTRVLAERAARLSAEQEMAERKTKEERSRAKGKAKAEAEAGVDTQGARTHQQAELVKKKKQQEVEERTRILKRIQDDREERRAKAAEKAQKRINSLNTGDVAASLVNAPQTKLPSTTARGDMTSLQVRMFDGSTIRSRFKNDSSFKEVRQWVDESMASEKTPYRFKQVLTPLPNKNIDDTEEAKPLAELGLSPSSTLLLIPLQQYVEAYGAPSSGSPISTYASAVMGFFAWLLAMIGLGGGRDRPETASISQNPSISTQGAAKDRKQKAENLQEKTRKQQRFYNGNSVRPHSLSLGHFP